jgi:hypothetical protein
VQNVADALVANLKQRLALTETNRILRLSMLVDPRFAFCEDFLYKFEWDNLEDEFVDFILSGSLIFPKNKKIFLQKWRHPLTQMICRCSLKRKILSMTKMMKIPWIQVSDY